MKKEVLISVLLVGVLFVSACSEEIGIETKIISEEKQIETPGETSPLYRLWKQSTFDHFFTSDENEKDEFLQQGYQLERITAYIFTTRQANTVPLHRLYNRDLDNRFYTVDDEEKEDYINNEGYEYELIVGYVYKVQAPNSVPLHRMFKAEWGDHFLTSVERIRSSAEFSTKYDYEKIIGYVYPADWEE